MIEYSLVYTLVYTFTDQLQKLDKIKNKMMVNKV